MPKPSREAFIEPPGDPRARALALLEAEDKRSLAEAQAILEDAAQRITALGWQIEPRIELAPGGVVQAGFAFRRLPQGQS
jgi:hypothetical protein